MKNIKNGRRGFIVPLLLIVFVIIVIIAVASSGGENNTNTESTENKQETSQESNAGLASTVESEYLEFWGIANLTELTTLEGVSLNTRSITGFEDYGSGNVLVNVQADVSEEEAKDVGKNVMGAVGLDVEDLDFIVVRGTNGRDVNVSRNDIPALR